MKVMSNDVTQKQKQTFYFSWTPKEEEGGKWKIEQKILGVKMDIDIGGSPIKYDSTAPAPTTPPIPLSEFFKALVGSTFKLTLDPKTLKITKIEGREEFVKKLVTANKQMQPLLEKILSEDALKEMAEPTFAVVSTDAVEKGKTWKKETTLDMGPIGKYKNEYTYTYEGPDSATKLDKIKVDTKLTYTPAGEGGRRRRSALQDQERRPGEQERHRHHLVRQGQGPRRQDGDVAGAGGQAEDRDRRPADQGRADADAEDQGFDLRHQSAGGQARDQQVTPA